MLNFPLNAPPKTNNNNYLILEFGSYYNNLKLTNSENIYFKL